MGYNFAFSGHHLGGPTVGSIRSEKIVDFKQFFRRGSQSAPGHHIDPCKNRVFFCLDPARIGDKVGPVLLA